jgi:hypothetical protein
VRRICVRPSAIAGSWYRERRCPASTWRLSHAVEPVQLGATVSWSSPTPGARIPAGWPPYAQVLGLRLWVPRAIRRLFVGAAPPSTQGGQVGAVMAPVEARFAPLGDVPVTGTSSRR